MLYKKISLSLLLLAAALATTTSIAQESPREEDFFKIVPVTTPVGVMLEVGGMTALPSGDLAVATRHGDVYIIENPTGPTPHFRKFATGLHEILGLAFKDEALYCAQRGELTKLIDRDMDGRADVYETVFSWPLSGHMHEYNYGPKIAPDGTFFVSTNVAFGDEEWWRGESRVPWRGWMLHIDDNGIMEPWAAGLRSPCGLGMINGDLFYTENQGDWAPTGGISQVKKGSFMGHPASLRWTGMPESPVHVTAEQLFAKFSERRIKDEHGKYIRPQNVINEKFSTPADVKAAIPAMQLPAVYLPHAILGTSTSEIVEIPKGNFGPFGGQVLVGDQGQSRINRIFLEKINGEYQGAAWEFRSGFQSGVLRMSWAKDGSLFVGETSRGWDAAGGLPEGLQRLVWKKSIPFEMLAVRAMPDGFEISFTSPVNKQIAADLAAYAVESFTYKYQPVYGSPAVNNKKHIIKGVKVSPDGMKVRIIVNSLRKHYIHAISLEGIRDAQHSYPLLHPNVYYTLHNIPEGSRLALSEVSTKNSGPGVNSGKAIGGVAATRTTATKNAAGAAAAKAAADANIKTLLTKNTCVACHNPDKRLVGPSFKEIALRRYSIEKMVKLIYNPQPQNWPGYSTEMPPMAQVPVEEARKIAAWINAYK